MDFPKMHMIVAKTPRFGIRIFVSDPDLAINMASFFQMCQWDVQLVDDVKKEEHPRTPREEHVAGLLVEAYNRWSKEAQG